MKSHWKRRKLMFEDVVSNHSFTTIKFVRQQIKSLVWLVSYFLYLFKLQKHVSLLLKQCGCININTIDWLFNSVYRWIGGIRSTHDSNMYKVEFRAVEAIWNSLLLHCNRLHPQLSKSYSSLLIILLV